MAYEENYAKTARMAARANAMLIPASSQQNGLLTATDYNNVRSIFSKRKAVGEGVDVSTLGPGFYVAPASTTGTPSAPFEPTPYAWFVDVSIAPNADKIIILYQMASSRMFKKVYPHSETNNNPSGWQMLMSESLLWSGNLVPKTGAVIKLSDAISNYQGLIIFYKYANLAYESRRIDGIVNNVKIELSAMHISDGSTDPSIKFIKFNLTAGTNALTINECKIINVNTSNGTSTIGTDLGAVSILKVVGIK